MILQLCSALDPSVAHIANLVGVELSPSAQMELIVKLRYKFSRNKVQESIANITMILNLKCLTV